VGTATDATLGLTLTSGPLSGNPSSPPINYTFNVYALNDTGSDSFSETGVVYNSAPGNDTSSGKAVNTSTTTLLGTYSVTTSNVAGDVVGISGANLVSAINADTNDRLVLIITRDTDYTEIGAAFATRENTTYSAPRSTSRLPPFPNRHRSACWASSAPACFAVAGRGDRCVISI
jgi:hypothetical protein